MILKKIFSNLKQDSRLHGVKCPVIGLTGGIATGKSTVSAYLKSRGLAVICADSLIKDIYGKDETKDFLAKNFPDSLVNQEIDFKKLRELAFSSDQNRESLESFLYQRLPAAFNEVFSTLGDVKTLIYDVPLLFEKNMESKFDISLCVYAPREMQIERLITRDGISKELAESILDKQLSIEEKKNRSDFSITNTSTLEKLEFEVDTILALLFD